MQPMTTVRPLRKTLRDGRRGEAIGRRVREVRTQPPQIRRPNAFALAYAEAQAHTAQEA